MTAATDWLEAEWIKWAFTAEVMGTRPTAWTVHLHTADPGEAGTASEVTGSGYVAQSATFTRTDNEVANTAAITFPTVTTTPYTVTHVSIKADGTNVLAKGALDVGKALAVGEAFIFSIGELKFNVN